jgi:RNA polymerase sigma-70 factor (ECF subfamily)
VGVELDAALDDARRGGPEGVAVLWRVLNPPLERYLDTLVGQAAPDVASETWLQAARDVSGFRGDGAGFRVWLFRIGRNRAIDELRRTGRRREELQAEPGGSADFVPDAATVAEERFGTRRAMMLLARLPREQAEAVLLRAVFGLDAKACAQILGKRPGAVRIAAMRGLRGLADLLGTAPAAEGIPSGIQNSAPGPIVAQSKGANDAESEVRR